MKRFFVFLAVGLFLVSFVFAESKITGALYDKIGLIGNDKDVENYINKISDETGAIVVIVLEERLASDYDTWAKDIATRMKLRDIGEPKKNVLIGYFREEGLVYVTSKNNGNVKKSLKDEVGSLIGVAIDSKSDEKFLDALKVLGEGLGVDEKGGSIKIPLEEREFAFNADKSYTHKIVLDYSEGRNEFEFMWNHNTSRLYVRGRMGIDINYGQLIRYYDTNISRYEGFTRPGWVPIYAQEDVLDMLKSRSFDEAMAKAEVVQKKRGEELVRVKLFLLDEYDFLYMKIKEGSVIVDYTIKDPEKFTFKENDLMRHEKKSSSHRICFWYFKGKNDNFCFKWDFDKNRLVVRGKLAKREDFFDFILMGKQEKFFYTSNVLGYSLFRNLFGMHSYEQWDVLTMLESKSFGEAVARSEAIFQKRGSKLMSVELQELDKDDLLSTWRDTSNPWRDNVF